MLLEMLVILSNKLTINYNRSRQASITKELMEIISGRRKFIMNKEGSDNPTYWCCS